MNIHNGTLIKLNDLLGLKFKGQEQDWALEFADSHRLVEFIEVLKTEALSEEEKYAMMSLILSSYDDCLNNNPDCSAIAWNEIVKLIEVDEELYFNLLNYWALTNEDDEGNLFAITPLIRTHLFNRRL
jgi:hypothetical protein